MAMTDARPPKPSDPRYRVGIMVMDVEGREPEALSQLVRQATMGFEKALSEEKRLEIAILSFAGPHLTPSGGAYAPLDFLEVGMAEKTERGLPFLLIVTEVDLSATRLAYTLSLPSPLTNIAVLSTKRLNPGFWGEGEEHGVAVDRLTSLMLHSFGHLLNLPYEKAPCNAMARLESVRDLDEMTGFSDAQLLRMKRTLPKEAHDRASNGGGLVEQMRLVLSVLSGDAAEILRSAVRAGPIRLIGKLPTLIAAAVSVITVLLFSPEIWDVASTVTMLQVTLFAGVAIAVALLVLYRAFALNVRVSREGQLTETAVVTVATTLLTLAASLLTLFAAFACCMYLAIVSIFPEKLMTTWPTVDPAVRTYDHVKMSLFLASMGIIAGSLGGRTDRRDLVRGVLFSTD